MPMIDPAKVEWNQTPFDGMTRDELLDYAKASHITLQRAETVLTRLDESQFGNPYWKPGGTGHTAVVRVANMTQRVNGDTDNGRENVHRSYFRYADQFHFPELTEEPWFINSEGHMIGGKPSRETIAAMSWADDFRLMTVEDMARDFD